MTWVKLDDSMPQHPKSQQAKLEGYGFDVAGISYSNRFGLNGFLPDHVLPSVFPEAASRSRRLADRLVAVGRWVRDDERGGYHIHDISDYQPSAQASEEKRDDISAKRSVAGKKGAQVRWGDGTDGKPMANEDGNCHDDAIAPSRPVPSRPLVLASSESLPVGVVANGERDPRVTEALAWLGEDDMQAYIDRGNEVRKRAPFLKSCIADRERTDGAELDAIAAAHPGLTSVELRSELEDRRFLA